MKITRTTDITDMPDIVTFDELLTWEGYANFVDNGFAYQVLFINGVFYTGRFGDETMRKCSPMAKLDYCFIRDPNP